MVTQTSALLMVLATLLSLSKGQSKTLVVTSILEPPFLFLKQFTSNGTQLSGNDRFEGYIADLLELVAKRAGFQYEIKLVPDGKFGETVRDGGGITWNGMIGELVKKSADIAAGPLTISSKRSRVVDFGSPFMASGIGILVKKEAYGLPDWRTSPFFTQTFSSGVLACIAVSLVVVVILFYLIFRFDPYERQCKAGKDGHNFGMMGALWLICGGLVLQGYAKRPKSVAAFFLVISWWMFCLILFANFLSKMINMESGQTIERRSSWTPEKLILDSNIKLLAINESNTASFLCTSRLYVYKKACERLVFANNSAEGVEKVLSGGYAFFMETPWIKYTTQRYCQLTSVDEILYQTFYGLATPLGSDTREYLLLGVLELRESGKLQELERKWWRNTGLCEGNQKAKAKAPLERSGPVTPMEIGNVFLFLLVGCALAVIAMSVEVIYFRFKGQKPTADQKPSDPAPDANNSQLPLQDTTEKNNDVTELA